MHRVEQSARQAVTLGGALITPPRYLPAAGTGAAVIDPLGATFGLYQGESRAGVQMLNAAGALSWNELNTGDPVRSVAYYQSLFGYRIEQRDDSPTAQPYTLLLLGDVPVAPSAIRAATAAADPPEEPPGTSFRLSPRLFHGLSTGP